MVSRPFFVLLELIMLSVLLFGCMTTSTTESNFSFIETASPVSISETRVPTLITPDTVLQSTQSPVPTQSSISKEKILQMVQKLHSIECSLPCYLGITPGKTNFEEAKLILEKYGGNTARPYMNTGNTQFYNYELWLTPDFFNSNKQVFHEIDLAVTNDVVEKMEVRLQAYMSTIPEFKRLWGGFSMHELFNNYGRPGQIYVDNTNASVADGKYTFVLDYQNIGFWVELSGMKKGESICPQTEDSMILETLILYDPAPNWRSVWAPSKKTSWVVTSEALSIDSLYFYQKILADATSCFTQTKRE